MSLSASQGGQTDNSNKDKKLATTFAVAVTLRFLQSQ
jgi:hypothetical protein